MGVEFGECASTLALKLSRSIPIPMLKSYKDLSLGEGMLG